MAWKNKGTNEYWKGYDTRFIFNKPYFNQWENKSYDHVWHYIVPCIYGFVFIHSLQFQQKKAEFTLISKKDCGRLGRRFVSRGLDEKGNASNFVETEHILVHYEEDSYRVASYVQIRGSIPLKWTQSPTLKYNPKLAIEKDMKKNVALAKLHFDINTKKYGNMVLVNLIDK